MSIHYLVVKREPFGLCVGDWFIVNTFKDKEEADFEIDSERQSGCKAKDLKRIAVKLGKGQRLKFSDIDTVLSKLNKEIEQ